jgi:hypothetical protein
MLLLSSIFLTWFQEFLHKHLFINLQIFPLNFSTIIFIIRKFQVFKGVLQYIKCSLELYHEPATVTSARCQAPPH